jgi:hypothetical protein
VAPWKIEPRQVAVEIQAGDFVGPVKQPLETEHNVLGTAKTLIDGACRIGDRLVDLDDGALAYTIVHNIPAEHRQAGAGNEHHAGG